MSQNKFREYFDTNLETLDLYTTAITRAHGESHPEAFDVRKIFESIQGKVAGSATDKLDLKADFVKLREITGNYEVPSDVCETYAAVYHMLAEADEAYQAK